MFGYKEKHDLFFMDSIFYCVPNSVITKQWTAAFVSTINNGKHIFTHCSC
jgi:hypothetical protein